MDIHRGVCVVLVLAAACGTREGAPANGEGAHASGEWMLELRLEHAPRPHLDAARTEPVRGGLVLLAQPQRRDASQPSHSGSHAIDARRFGITLRHGRVPGALAWAQGDSLRMVLDPDAPGGGLVLRGVFSGDSAVGTWTWHGAGLSGPGAAGGFVLRRR